MLDSSEPWFIETIGALVQQMTDVKMDRVKHTTNKESNNMPNRTEEEDDIGREGIRE